MEDAENAQREDQDKGGCTLEEDKDSDSDFNDDDDGMFKNLREVRVAALKAK